MHKQYFNFILSIFISEICLNFFIVLLYCFDIVIICNIQCNKSHFLIF